MTQQEKVIDRVRKLFALAGNNPSQAEAQSAMMKAQDILAEAGLSMLEVTPASTKIEVGTASLGESRRLTWWRRTLSATISKHMRCAVYIRKQWNRVSSIVMVGARDDVQVAQETYKLAEAVLQREATRFVRQKKAEVPVHGWVHAKSGLRNAWILGFIMGLDESFKANEDAHGTALVLVRPKEVDEHLSSLRLRKAQSSSITCSRDSSASASGYREGQRFNGRGRIK